MELKAAVGNKGEKVRSDCYIELEIKDSGGLLINLKSKVNSIYGKEIKDLIIKILEFYQLGNVVLTIDDSGSLPFVIAARTEAAINQCLTTGKEYILPLLEENKYTCERDSLRISRLYLPGNNPSLMINAGIHKPHGIILDLEDSVAFDRKPEARVLVRNALCQLDFFGCERMVRINQIPEGLKDLPFIIPYNVHLILIPKCESPDQVKAVSHHIKLLKRKKSSAGPVHLMPIIESAMGVEKSFEIATSSPEVVALAIGLEDYTADIGVQRTTEGNESLYARTRLVNACKAAGIQPIDSVFSDFDDLNTLETVAQNSKKLGFEGMGCIHPLQIGVIHKAFSPGLDEIEKAKKIVSAFMTAQEKGLAVISLGSKMIDAPVVKRSLKILELAVKSGTIPGNWREDYNEN